MLCGEMHDTINVGTLHVDTRRREEHEEEEEGSTDNNRKEVFRPDNVGQSNH